MLGAGFGGLAAARKLGELFAGDERVEIVLVDQRNFHLFTPLLYQVSTGLVEPDHTVHPVRGIARGQWFAFRESVVKGIDFETREVQTDDGPIPYDHLVIALGSTTNFFGTPGAAEFAFTLKTLRDGVRLRNRFNDCFERAEESSELADQRRVLTFVVVGGGATGVELATSLMNLVDIVLIKDYPSIPRRDVRVILVEAKDRILPTVDPQLGAWAQRYLDQMGIETRLDTAVTRISPDGIETKHGERIDASTVVWAAGVRANDVVGGLDVERARDGRLRVTEQLELPGRPDVYVIGDNALYDQTADGHPLPANAPIAIQQGELVARNIRAAFDGQPKQRFVWKREGELISLGRNAAVGEIFGRRLTGFPAWIAWRTVYLAKLQGFKNRAGVIVDWFFAYAFRRRETARLES